MKDLLKRLAFARPGRAGRPSSVQNAALPMMQSTNGDSVDNFKIRWRDVFDLTTDRYPVEPEGSSYGRVELRKSYKKYLLRGLLVGAAVELSAVGSYYGVQYLQQDDAAGLVRVVRIVKYSELGPPPSMTDAASLPQIAVATAAVKPSIGIPVPVPDAQVNPEQTFATQQQLSAVQSPATETGAGQGQGVEISKDVSIEDDPGMNDFVPVEKEPQVVREVKPVYPEMAVKAGIEGTVWVKILVGKDGKPKKVVVIKEIPSGIFTDSAKEAAMQFLFTPALMNRGPVPVWVTFPFKYTVRSKSAS